MEKFQFFFLFSYKLKIMKLLITLFFAAGMFISVHTTAQSGTLKKVLELKMPKTADDDMCGTRGAAVCWNAANQKYYAAFAGNKEFPLGIFDIKGKRISEDDLTTMVDTRGLWYNTVNKKVCGNGYAENGWFSYILDKKGIPSDFSIDQEGMNQPVDNSVGAYKSKTNEIIFISNDMVSFYDKDASSNKTVTLRFGQKKQKTNDGEADDDNISDDYNNTSVIYTGFPGSEIGVLNFSKKQVELYNEKTGLLVKILVLPDDAVAEQSFNFAYANGIFWLFNMEERQWTGYK